jgi:hypothetical protein
MTGPPVAARASSDSGRHSRLRRGTNSVPTNSSPIAKITMPAMWRITSRFSASVRPMLVAVIPSATNITVNERQKSSEGPSTFRLPRPS